MTRRHLVKKGQSEARARDGEVNFVKKEYEKPTIESESVFETLATGCSMINPYTMAECEDTPIYMSMW